MSFVAHFPYLTRSIILLTPSGITWSLPSGYRSTFFRYSTFVPLSYLRRLGGNIGAKLGMEPQICPKSKESTVHDAESQISTDSAHGAKQFINVFSVMQWQFDNHWGFFQSFVNSSQHGPVWHQRSNWNKFREIIRGKRKSAGYQSSHLPNSKFSSF